MDVVAAAGRLWRRLSLRAMFMLGVGVAGVSVKLCEARFLEILVT
jgi:hypothetical protein